MEQTDMKIHANQKKKKCKNIVCDKKSNTRYILMVI